jgi:prepilin-type N-terminal cleavage/methylation domain-containing protein
MGMVRYELPRGAIPVAAPGDRRARPRDGFTLIELTVSVTIFALALMSTGLTLLHGVRHQDETVISSNAVRAVRDFFAEVQEIANQPQDLGTYQGISAIYEVYNGMVRTVPELPGGTISIIVYSNETNVPAVLGGPQDMNFDGDAGDNFGGVAAGTDMQIVPIALTITYTDERGPTTATYYRRIAQTRK